MIGISISLYDKFHDLAILVDIIRENWTRDYFISVCSNHPEATNKIDSLDLDIDEFIHGAKIEYDPSMEGLREQINRTSRVYDTISKAATGAIKNPEVNHVMHVHADAWPLSEEHVHQLINDMETRDAVVAFKGKGLTHRGHRLVGHMMDQFFVFDAEYARSNNLFGHSPVELLPDRGIHTMFAILLLGKVGWSNVYFYSNQSEQVYWDGKSATGARPMIYNPDWKYLHLAKEDFPDSLGRALQACYLRDHDITAGSNVSELIGAHTQSLSEVSKELEKEEKRINKRIKIFGLDDLGRNFRVAQNYLDKSPAEKAKFLAQGGVNRIIKRLSSLNPLLDSLLEKELPRRDPVARADKEIGLRGVYKSNLDPDDFENIGEGELWFDKDE